MLENSDLMGCSLFHLPDLGRSFLVPIGLLSCYGKTYVLCHTKFVGDRDLPLFLDGPFGSARVEFMSNSTCSSGIGFIGLTSMLSSRYLICSIYTLHSYPELLFVQHAIMGQSENWGPFSLHYTLSSCAHFLDLVMTLVLASIRLHSPQTEVRSLCARILPCLTWPSV